MKTNPVFINQCLVYIEAEENPLELDYNDYDMLMNKITSGDAHFTGRGVFGEEIYVRLDAITCICRRTAAQWEKALEAQKLRRALIADD